MKYLHIEGCKLSKPHGKHDSVTCYTHNVEVCRCGWQVGFHFGSYSKALQNEPQTPAQYRSNRIHRYVEKYREELGVKSLSDSELDFILNRMPATL